MIGTNQHQAMLISSDAFLFHVVPFTCPATQWSLRHVPGCPLEIRNNIRVSKSRDFIDHALMSNSLEWIKWLCQDEHLLPNNRHVGVAASYSNIDVVQWLVEQVTSNNEPLMLLRAPTDLRIYQLLLQHHFVLPDHTLDLVIKNSDLEMVQWLTRNTKHRLNARHMIEVAATGNLSLIQWVHDQVRHIASNIPERVMGVAARIGNLDTMKWLQTKGYPLTEHVFQMACINGQLDNLQWLLKMGCPMSATAFLEAMKNFHVQVIDWLHEMNCPTPQVSSNNLEIHYMWESRVSHVFWRHGLDRLIWLEERDLWDPVLSTAICYVGIKNLLVAKWLHSKNAWTKDKVAHVIKFGSLPVIQWLHTQSLISLDMIEKVGCNELFEWFESLGATVRGITNLNHYFHQWKEAPKLALVKRAEVDALGVDPNFSWSWSTKLIKMALAAHDFELADWMLPNLESIRIHGKQNITIASETADLEIVKWAIKHDLPHDTTLEFAIKEERLDTLHFMLERIDSIKHETVLKVIELGSLEFLRPFDWVVPRLDKTSLEQALRTNGNKRLAQEVQSMWEEKENE